LAIGFVEKIADHGSRGAGEHEGGPKKHQGSLDLDNACFVRALKVGDSSWLGCGVSPQVIHCPGKKAKSNVQG
jgi:hypothetical protein